MQAIFVSGNPATCDYTPESAVSAGDVIIVGETSRISRLDIAADELGTLDCGGGIYQVICLDTAGIDDGTKVYWDDVGNGVTKDLTSGGAPFGFAVEDGTVGAAFKCIHNPAVA